MPSSKQSVRAEAALFENATMVEAMNTSVRLTGRTVERQVLEMVSHGFQNKLIAAKFSLSEHTEKVHIHNIMKKLRVQNPTAAAAIFLARAADASRRNSTLAGHVG